MYKQMIASRVLQNGDKVEIQMRFDENQNTIMVQDIGIIPKGKRKMTFMYSSIRDSYSYRRLDVGQRWKYLLNEYVNAVGLDILNEALLETWESIKPKPITESDLEM